ncbi:MAG: winged helix DNA-binding domain-containing protein [Thermoleophilia bacterium]
MSPPHIGDAERRARLMWRHHLARDSRIDDPARIADDLVGLHSSDPATVYLSLWARMRTPSVAGVRAALDGELLRHHAMRRTLWVMSPPVARAAHAASTAGLAAEQWRRLAGLVHDSGIADDGAAWCRDAREELLDALRAQGAPTSARALGRLVPRLAAPLQLAVGKPYAGTQGAHSRLLMCLAFDGAVTRFSPERTWNSGEYLWGPMEARLPEGIAGMDAMEARAAIAHRYLWAFGPATTDDVRWWTGWTKTHTVRALADAGSLPCTTEAGAAWLAHDDRSDSGEPEARGAAFLPSLDPTAMGWRHRGFAHGELTEMLGPLCDRAGNVGPTVWLDGAIVGGWGQRPDGEVVYRTLAPVPARRRRELDAAAAELTGLMDGTVVKPRFPTALAKELAA